MLWSGVDGVLADGSFVIGVEGLPLTGVPATLRSYREALEDKPRQFNKTRAAVQAYLRDGDSVATDVERGSPDEDSENRPL